MKHSTNPPIPACIDHEDAPFGYLRLGNAALNKSTAFTQEERIRYKLEGLLPPAISTQKEQQTRVLENMARKRYDIERYIFLQALLGRNERLFYKVLLDHIDNMMPLVYTPTVGQACQEFAHIFRQTRGLYITAENRGRIKEVIGNWPIEDVRLIVVTDGERILGLGDLGANGMGIPIGKLSLYVACAGVYPHQCLPIMLDVGTKNETLREDPLYLGLRQPRLQGDDYYSLVEEFVNAVQEVFPHALIQFEDFLTPNAYRLLNTYRKRVLCFNDDIQGTATVALAGILASNRITGHLLRDLRILFLGAGSAATGIADLIVLALQEAGLSESEAHDRLYFVDRKGLIVANRQHITPHSQPYTHEGSSLSFTETIKNVKPQILIGATGSPGTFTQEVIQLMAQINDRPVIFALSNPTSKAECTAEQAYTWSDGRAVFASGSPFDKVIYNGKTLTPGQGNNAYAFPGIGLGAIACESRLISNDMFLTAARALAEKVDQEDLDTGLIYPPLTEIREVSLAIATAVAEKAYQQGLARIPRPEDLSSKIKGMMYDPSY